MSPAVFLMSHHKKILSYLHEKQFITDRNYALLVDRPKPKRALDFQKLVNLQLIERKGRGRAVYYVLKGKTDDTTAR